jgi:hypothetical protein
MDKLSQDNNSRVTSKVGSVMTRTVENKTKVKWEQIFFPPLCFYLFERKKNIIDKKPSFAVYAIRSNAHFCP